MADASSITLAELARKWNAADEEWMEELEREFPGCDRGTLRYERRAEGKPGSTLRAAFEKWKFTGAAWESLLKGDVERMGEYLAAARWSCGLSFLDLGNGSIR